MKNLTPLKSPPTMISGTSLSGCLNSSAGSSVSPLLSTPLPPNAKLRIGNNGNTRRANNYEPTYRNALINSSKTCK